MDKPAVIETKVQHVHAGQKNEVQCCHPESEKKNEMKLIMVTKFQIKNHKSQLTLRLTLKRD